MDASEAFSHRISRTFVAASGDKRLCAISATIECPSGPHACACARRTNWMRQAMTSFLMNGPTSRRAAMAASKRLQLFSASLAEIPQRIDVSVDPTLPHLMQGDIRREIGVDDDANHRVRSLHHLRRG